MPGDALKHFMLSVVKNFILNFQTRNSNCSEDRVAIFNTVDQRKLFIKVLYVVHR